ncbi:MAG: translesion error-prone DNA polymerase V autoproteolytic subunit [Ktedonobacterales bacterium]|nr:translesion error-prone DNA polymerase V autoproteolytic subunit [Ktedonobacterales bacterium]
MSDDGRTTGFPNPTSDHSESSLDLHRYAMRHPEATFFWTADGDAMQGAGIFHGDILVVDRLVEARLGDVVVAWVGQDYLVRRLGTSDSHVALLPEHPDFVTIVFAEAEECEVWGVVTYVLHDPNQRGRR